MLADQEILLMQALRTPQAQKGQADINGRLAQITRYNGLTMIHPSRVDVHQELVAAIAFHVLPWVEEVGVWIDIEPTTVLRLGRFHDDHESDKTVGDVTLDRKDEMTEEQLDTLEAKTHAAHLKLAEESYHLVPGSDEHKQYLQDKADLQTLATPEAEMSKIGDTLHATWEVMHECLAGNEVFYGPLERYESYSLKLAMRSPIWQKLRYHPSIQLDPNHFPTREQIRDLPKITRPQIMEIRAEDSGSWSKFLKTIHNPDYPVWYRNGCDAIMLAVGHALAPKVMFPNWRQSFYED